ncbi:hypothetical protein LCGC14_0403270 [marine sediment metagenome]|uniref:Uncharacterized protein n=1 Tax=marine sediment metagenome TaxID=412755 RepID=A0A0F9SW42_9ZZZZ
MMKLLCFIQPHKWVHITDVVWGKNEFKADLILGLYQCVRCKTLLKGSCGNRTTLTSPKASAATKRGKEGDE